MKRVHVTKSDPPESKEILAAAIVRISESLTELRHSGLNEKAIVVLVHDATKIAKRDILRVLFALRQLKGWYCR